MRSGDSLRPAGARGNGLRRLWELAIGFAFLCVTAHASWILQPGYTNCMTTLGDTIYGGAAPAGGCTRLAGNTTTTPEILTSTGSGSLATAPQWKTYSGAGLCPAVGSPINHSVLTDNGSGCPQDATNAATIPAITYLGTAATDSASLGAELTTSAGCSGTGWTGTYPTYVPPGTTAPLTCTLTGGTLSATPYQVLITIASYAAGTLTCTLGGASVAAFAGNNSTPYGPWTTSTAALICTPTAPFITANVTVSVKKISPITVFSMTGKDSSGNPSVKALYSQTAALANVFIGGGGAYNTTGGNNTANGYQALYSNTTGASNTANGYQALYSNTTGASNTANGYQALYSNTTGVQQHRERIPGTL